MDNTSFRATSQKNFIISVVTFLLFCVIGNAQVQKQSATTDMLNRWINSNPENAKRYAIQEKQLLKNDSAFNHNINQNKPAATIIYTIPVVFHILHQNGYENISDARVLKQLDILNKDFRKQNADTASIFPPFIPADAFIEFRLAQRDTNGYCTSGIVRHYDPNTFFNYPASPSQYSHTWDSKKYLNIYIVNSIGPGYSYCSSPPGINTPEKDVIIITYYSIGDSLNSGTIVDRFLTQAVGMFFNLNYTFGAGNGSCGDDGVSDTPITVGAQGCYTQAICNSTVQENVQNFMDFGCPAMFTLGQVNRMHQTLTTTRSYLCSTFNLVTAGIIHAFPCTQPLISTSSTVCVGESLTFTDVSGNFNAIQTRTWSVTGGGTISSQNTSVTTINFPNIGTQTVSLLVSNPAGNLANSIQTILVENHIPDFTATYQESFENPGLPAHFIIHNLDSGVTWQQTNIGAASGSKCYYINYVWNTAGAIDILESPSYDFLNNPDATFTFKCAYAKYYLNSADEFKVQARNCTVGWTNIFTPSPTNLATGSGGLDPVPLIPDPWQFKTIRIDTMLTFAPFLNSDNVRFRFYFKKDTLTGLSNNIFLDDINFEAPIPTGLIESAETISFNLFPNPASDIFYLKFNLIKPTNLSYQLTTVSGAIVKKADAIPFETGEHTFEVKVKLIPGLYFLTLNINGRDLSKKVLIK